MTWKESNEGLNLGEPEEDVGDDTNDSDLDRAGHVISQDGGVDGFLTILILGGAKCVDGSDGHGNGNEKGGDPLE